MRRMLPGSIVSYSRYGHLKIPKSIHCKCPNCGRKGEFTLKADYQSNRMGLFAQGRCPECRGTSSFVMMMNDYLDPSNEEVDVYLYDPHSGGFPFEGMEENVNIPADLIRAYRSAVNVYQAKDPAATAVMAKRVLESVAKNFTGKSRDQSLAQQYEKLPGHVDLAKPIQTLSQLLHPEGKLVKMLELETEMDEEMAGLLINLLNGVIEYLYLLPVKMENTYERMEQKL